MKSYLYLPRVRVQTANAHATSWLVNCAPVMALTMFGHNLGRNIDAHCTGVAVVHHDAGFLGDFLADRGRRAVLRPQQRRAATYIDKDDYGKDGRTLSLQPTITCHLELSLVIELSGFLDLEQVDRFMQSARIAGGQVISYGKPSCFDSEEAASNAVRGGFWVVERSDLMAGGENPLQTVLSATAFKVGEAAQEKRDWLVPTVLGYATLTGFTRRPGVREGVQHAFCESLVGLVQYLPVKREKVAEMPFWRHEWLSEEVFVIKQSTSN